MEDNCFNDDDFFLFIQNIGFNIINDNESEEPNNLEKELYNIWNPIVKNDNEEKKRNETIKEETNNKEKKISNINILISNKTKRPSKPKKKKLDDENMRKDCKHILLKNIFNFINNKISEKYNYNIGQGICIKQLQSLNQKQKSESSIDFNKEFLQKTLNQIFSETISPRITNFSKNHNKDLIQDLLNEKDIEKKKYFNNLFNLTFLQCLEHFRETDYHDELNGMPVLKDEIKQFEEDDYIQSLLYYFKNYENIIKNKRSRNRNKKKKDDNNKNEKNENDSV